MSWKYASYNPRDLSSSRDASQIKFGLSNSKLSSSPGDRWSSTISVDSKFCRNSIEPVEHSPLWAKTRVADNSASVQRMKERYNVSEESSRETKPYKKAETKDLSSAKSGRQYGRSLTTAILSEPTANNPRFRRLLEKAPEPDKTRRAVSPLEGRKLLYMPTTTTKLFARKYSNDLSPTTVNVVTKDRDLRYEAADNDQETITVVNRATSPTPIKFTVYLRSKRTDIGLEKTVPKPRRRPSQMEHKEVQTDRESSLAKYAAFSESGSRAPWSPFGGGSYGSKFSPRSNYECDRRPAVSDCRRSNSREDSASANTPEFPYKSFATKPPTSIKTPPTSPLKDSEKKILDGKSPSAGIRPPLTLDCAKSELDRRPNPPTQLSSPLQCKVTDAEALAKQTGGRSPTVTIDHCPDIAQTIEDVSSMSESSEDETSSDEECNKPVPLAMAVKKSVTNFLQNIPNHLPQNQSRSGLVCQKAGSLSPQKVNLKLESGERCWWTEEGVARAKSTRSVPNQDLQSPEGRAATNFLSPPYLLNRQFSRDKDWLKGSFEDVSGSPSPKEDLSPRTNHSYCQGLTNGEAFVKSHRTGNCNSAVEFGEESFSASGPLRRRDYSKSPDNFLAGDLNEQMKFNQQSGDYPRECSVKEKSQKLQNGKESPLEEKGLLEAGNMSGMISKAKAGLANSKTKLDLKKSSSREMSPKVTDTKSEIDLYWRELADSLTRPLKLCDLDFTDLTSDDETDLFTNSTTNSAVPPPPPMLVLPVPAFIPPRNSPNATPTSPRTRAPAPPPVPQLPKNKKTVKLFWREVKDDLLHQPKAPNGLTLIWEELPKVNVDTQKLEYLFESRAKDLLSKKQQDQNKNKELIVLDPKRSNAINIGMTKLPPPRAIKTAILKMDATVVNKEGIDKLLTMLPTEEEKLRIQEAQSANPDIPLGSAEQFLITLASIIELEARLRLWAFKLNFDNNEKDICDPLMDLKQGIDILRSNKTFRSILATLLSVGNFLNGYDVKGFHIDYLAKVPEVKDTVHKHSLLHHLCLIVMDKFPDSTDLYSEIGAVTRASKVDFDELAANIEKVEQECKLSWNYLKMIAKHEGHTAMKVKMSDFLADCAERIIVVGIVHKRIMSRFHKFCFWLGVPLNRMTTTRPNEIFKTISEFALEYRTTRDRILQQIKKISREKTRTRGHFAHDSKDVVTPKMNSKEAKDDDRLKRLLQDDTTYSENSINAPTWRRQRKDTRNLLLQEANNNDEEILDALIKTANQMPSPRLRERRRSRIYGKYSHQELATVSLCTLCRRCIVDRKTAFRTADVKYKFKTRVLKILLIL